jgi:hypothetical protein
MELPIGCLSVNSLHLEPASAEFLATVDPYHWPFLGAPYGGHVGFFCRCETFSVSPSRDPFSGFDILAAFELAKSRDYGWVMFHQGGTRHRSLRIRRKLKDGLDPFLGGVRLEKWREIQRQKTRDWLWSLKNYEDITF